MSATLMTFAAENRATNLISVVFDTLVKIAFGYKHISGTGCGIGLTRERWQRTGKPEKTKDEAMGHQQSKSILNFPLGQVLQNH